VDLVRGAPEIAAFGADSQRLADLQAADDPVISLASPPSPNSIHHASTR
jgi:hypothetical protein